MTEPRKNELAILEGKKDDENVWIENLLTGKSVYHSDKTKDKYEMEPYGIVGSIIPVPVKVAKEGFLRRSILRNNIRFLTNEEEAERSPELVFQEEEAANSDRLLKAMEEGASDVGSRFTKQGLSDDGNEKAPLTARQVLAGSPNPTRPDTVHRSDTSDSNASVDQVPGNDDAPIPVVITEPVKEGEWTSDTGAV